MVNVRDQLRNLKNLIGAKLNRDLLTDLKWTRGEILSVIHLLQSDMLGTTTEEDPIGARTSCCLSKELCTKWITLKIPHLV